jgi:type II secretory pathway component GspD/PulD (secretin)
MKSRKPQATGRMAFLIVLSVVLFISFSFAQETTPCAGNSPERISLDLKGVDVIELFKLLSIKTGLTIVPQPGIKGRVNLFLNNVCFEDVLDIILITYNLACERRANIINILTADQFYKIYGKAYEEKRQMATFKLNYAKPVNIFNTLAQLKSDIGKIIVDESTATIVLIDIPEKLDLMAGMIKQLDQPPETEVFGLKYAKAKDLEAQVSKVLTTGPGEIAIDERTNKVIIADLPDKMSRIKRMVRAFDEEPSQVLIDAQIIELTLNDKFQRGISWEGIFKGLDDLDFKGTFSLGLTGSGQEVSVGTVAKNDYNIVLQMLETYGRTRILSQPRITAVNNQEAKILVGAREAYITQTLSTATSATTTAESIEYVDVGVKLNVTPSISRDGFITMKIRPEVSSVREYITTKLGSRIPIVSTSEVETVVKVKDGAMIMIAGLTKQREEEARNEIPLLAKIPIIGMFFGNKTRGSDSPKTTELVILLTPRIVTGNVIRSAELESRGLVLKKEPKGLKEE